MNNILLEVKNLHVSFKNKNLINDISLHVHKSEIVGLVGESGSGKSLTSLAITGLLPSGMSCTGKIFFHQAGKTYDLTSDDVKKVRGRNITMIFQDSLLSLNPVVRCGIQATEGLRWVNHLRQKDAKKEIYQWFESVKLHPPDRFFNAYPHQLSGGQRQRIMIAAALSVTPDLLIADEPTTALDPIMQKEIIEILRSIHQQTDIAILFISHDLQLVRNFCHRVYIMHEGQIVEAGDPVSIFSIPRESYTRSLISSLPTVQTKKSSSHLKTSPAVLSVRNLSVSYHKKQQSYKVLDKISFDVLKNETVGIVGLSGQGKTTLIKSLMLLQSCDEGEIIFEGLNVLKLPARNIRKLRSRIQIVFQESRASFHPSMSIRKQLLEPMKIHHIFSTKKEMMDYVKILIEKTDLPLDCLQRYPHQLSGGQLQRLQIVRALSLKPSLVFLDEAISALDIRLKKQILDLLMKLKAEFDLTFLFVSHEFSYVRYFCDRMYVLHEGKLLEGKETEDVFQHPEHDITRELIRSAQI